MGLQGYPDWGQSIRNINAEIVGPYEVGQTYSVAPRALGIATTPQGNPDIRLELVRGHSLASPYGLLDLRLQFQYPMENGLILARQQDSRATIVPWVPRSGFLRWIPRTVVETISSEILQSIELRWNSLDQARYQLKLSQANALFLKSCLSEQFLPLMAIAEVELEGVLPRLPLTVKFNPSDVIAALLKLSDDQRRISCTRALEYFQRPIRELPIGLTGELHPEDVQAWSEAMVGRLRSHWGRSVPSPDALLTAHFQLISDIPNGQFTWNLEEATLGVRSQVLTLDGFELVSQYIQTQGLSAVVKETEVPAFPTGVFPLTIAANLPSNRQGILRLGVNVRVPPKLPQRPQAVMVTTELKPPQDSVMTTLRLGVRDTLDYWASTFVILKDATGIQRFNAPETRHQSHHLMLYPDDFEIEFITIEADPDLLEFATIRATLRRPDRGKWVIQSFDLGQDPMAIALPKTQSIDEASNQSNNQFSNESSVTLEFELSSIDPNSPIKTLKLGPMTAQDTQLSLYAFATYGPQTLIIQRPAHELSSLTLELSADGPNPQSSTILNLSPSQSIREWTWFSDSPFYGGYRYRLYRVAGKPVEPWSTLQFPNQPLILQSTQVSL